VNSTSNISHLNTEEDLNAELFKLFRKTDSNDISRIIFTGGTSPKCFYKFLSNNEVDWSKYIVTLSDERDIETSNHLSNEGMIKSIICNNEFDNIFLSLRNPETINILKEVTNYDLCILGMGEDGHFASIFPSMSNIKEALNTQEPLLNIDDGFPDIKRISMSLNEIKKSKKIILIIKSKTKLALLKTKRNSDQLLPIDKLIEECTDRLTIYTLF